MRVVIVPRWHIWPEVLPEHEERLKAAGADEVIVANDRETLLKEIRTADALFGSIDREILEHAGQLKWVQALSSGVDEYLFPEFVESDVILTSEKGLVGEHLADHAFAHLLVLTRSMHTALKLRKWTGRREMRGNNRELSGMTAGIVGLGGTGDAIARRAAAFNMRCIAVDPDVTEAPSYVEYIVTPDKLLDVAAESNVLFVGCPKTKDTINLIGKNVFDAMPERSYVINVTRGGIIDEDALVDAINSGKVYGAGLDVTAEEPLAEDSPLWGLENVIITPHTAGASQHRVSRIMERVFSNIQRFNNGEPLEGIIDKHKGY